MPYIGEPCNDTEDICDKAIEIWESQNQSDKDKEEEEGCGCDMTGGSAPSGLFFAMVLVGLLAFMKKVRRRS